MDNVCTGQLDNNGAFSPQTQSADSGAADVNIASGSVSINQDISGITNAVVVTPGYAIGSAPPAVSCAAYVASMLIKAGKGKLYGISGYSSKGSAQFIQIFDSPTLPAEGAIPSVLLTVGATGNFSADFGIYGRPFLTGIYVVNSSTGPTKTIGSADTWFDARYV